MVRPARGIGSRSRNASVPAGLTLAKVMDYFVGAVQQKGPCLCWPSGSCGRGSCDRGNRPGEKTAVTRRSTLPHPRS